MANPWVEHCKAYAKKHKCSYRDAIKLAGPSYKKKKVVTGGSMKKIGLKMGLSTQGMRRFLLSIIIPRIVAKIGDSTGGFGAKKKKNWHVKRCGQDYNDEL